MAQKHIFAIILNICVLAISLILANNAIAGEEEIALLQKFEKLKASTETNISYDTYYELLSEVKAELNLYKQKHKREDPHKDVPENSFDLHVGNCLIEYEQAGESWKSARDPKYSGFSFWKSERENERNDHWKTASKELAEAYDAEKKMSEEEKLKVEPKPKKIKTGTKRINK